MKKGVRWVSATLPKMYSLVNTFQGFRSDLLLSIFIRDILRKFISQKNLLVVAANSCKVFQNLFPQKLYIQDRILGSE